LLRDVWDSHMWMHTTFRFRFLTVCGQTHTHSRCARRHLFVASSYIRRVFRIASCTLLPFVQSIPISFNRLWDFSIIYTRRLDTDVSASVYWSICFYLLSARTLWCLLHTSYVRSRLHKTKQDQFIVDLGFAIRHTTQRVCRTKLKLNRQCVCMNIGLVSGRLNVLVAKPLAISVFWAVAPCSVVDIRRFRGTLMRMMTHGPDEGSKYLWNVDEYLPDYTAQHPRR
jgi:hypothetical protein